MPIAAHGGEPGCTTSFFDRSFVLRGPWNHGCHEDLTGGIEEHLFRSGTEARNPRPGGGAAPGFSRHAAAEACVTWARERMTLQT